MISNAFAEWHSLHVRVARGEVLTTEEHAAYEAGLQELDRDEHIAGDLGRLRQLRESVAQLESENRELRRERAKLDRQIAAVEARLSEETRRELGIGVG